MKLMPMIKGEIMFENGIGVRFERKGEDGLFEMVCFGIGIDPLIRNHGEERLRTLLTCILKSW